jgi:antitoxin VapB
MSHTTPYRSNRSLSVRPPKPVALPPELREVVVRRDGKRRVVVPADPVWDEFFDASGIDLPNQDELEAESREPL